MLIVSGSQYKQSKSPSKRSLLLFWSLTSALVRCVILLFERYLRFLDIVFEQILTILVRLDKPDFFDQGKRKPLRVCLILSQNKSSSMWNLESGVWICKGAENYASYQNISEVCVHQYGMSRQF